MGISVRTGRQAVRQAGRLLGIYAQESAKDSPNATGQELLTTHRMPGCIHTKPTNEWFDSTQATENLSL